DRIDAEADDLRVALVELGFEPGHVAQLRGAHRREVLGVREEHAPGPAEPLVKADTALGCLSVEVRSHVANLQCHAILQLCNCVTTPQADQLRPRARPRTEAWFEVDSSGKVPGVQGESGYRGYRLSPSSTSFRSDCQQMSPHPSERDAWDVEQSLRRFVHRYNTACTPVR